jgi:hypothetical protein
MFLLSLFTAATAPDDTKAVGIVVSKLNQTLNVRDVEGTKVTSYEVAADAKVMLDNFASSLDKIEAGNFVNLTISQGKVVMIDAKSGTLQRDRRQAVPTGADDPVIYTIGHWPGIDETVLR